MKSLIYISILLFSNVLNAQKPPDTVYFKTPLADREMNSIKSSLEKAGVMDEVRKRERNLEFFKTQTLMTEPGTLSGACITDFTFNSKKSHQKKPFVLNGDIFLPISFGGKSWGLNTLQFIPQVKVRILNNDKSQGDSSLPVRTPSYMPTLIYYFSFKKLHSFENNHHRFYFGGLKAFHHSNGQDGNEFDTLGNINTYNGNFSENAAFEVLFGKSKEFYYGNKSASKLAGEYPSNAMYYYKLGFEFHPNVLSNMEIGKYHIYGHNRLNFQAGFLYLGIYNEFIKNSKGDTTYQVAKQVLKECWRFVANITYIMDDKYNSGDNINNLTAVPYLSVKRLNIYATAYYIIPGSVNAAAFLQVGYWGSDTYNIYFQQSLTHIRFGLAFTFFKYPKSGDLVNNTYR